MSPRAAALVAGLVTAAWIAVRDPAWLSIPSAYSGYQLSDPAAVQLIEPVLHAPWLGPIAWIFAALLALCLASEAWLLAIVCGATGAAALAAVAAMALSAPWIDTVRQGGPLAIALAFTWLAWMFILKSAEDRRLVSACAGIACWMVAIASSWLAILVAPMVFAGLTVSEHRRRVRLARVAIAAAAGLGGVALYCARIASLATTLTVPGGPQPSAVDVLTTFLDQTLRWQQSWDVAPGLTLVVPAAFAALGVVGASLRKRWRVSIVISGACIAGVALVWPLWADDAMAFGGWLATPFIGVGLTAVGRALAPRWRVAAAAVGGVAICLASLSDAVVVRAAHDVTSAQRALQPLLGSLAVDGAAFVAEDVEVDAAVIAGHGAQPGWRLARDAAYAAELADRGRTVLAGPVGRRHLELAGFRFQALAADSSSTPFVVSRVTAQLHCAVVRTDRWSLLPGVEYTGRLGVEIPGALGGAMTFIIGDDHQLPLVLTDARGDEHKLKIEPLLTAPSADPPPPDYWFDGGDPARAPRQVFRVVLPAHPTATTLFDFALGRRSPRVLARLSGFDSGARGRVCAAPLAAPELWTDPDAPREVIVPLAMSTMLTGGWYGVETDPSAKTISRWSDLAAVVLVSSGRRTAVRIALDAEPAVTTGERPVLALAVNGIAQQSFEMSAGSSRYEWTVPVSTWLAGTNELLLTVSRGERPTDVGGGDRRVLGMKVTRVALTREGE